MKIGNTLPHPKYRKNETRSYSINRQTEEKKAIKQNIYVYIYISKFSSVRSINIPPPRKKESERIEAIHREEQEGRRRGHRAHLSVNTLNFQTANHSLVSLRQTGAGPPLFTKNLPPCPPPICPLLIFGFWVPFLVSQFIQSFIGFACLRSFLV